MISNRLREESKEAHILLEKQVVKVLKKIRSDQDYLKMLEKFYTYFSQVEKAIAPFLTTEILPDYGERRNSTYIGNDIRELNGTIPNSVQITLPDINDIYQAFGALYVMEGSIMGGRTIVQILEKHNVTKGISFFSGYGDDTMKMWSVFTETINKLPRNEADGDSIVQAARETFSNFGRLFEESNVLDEVQG